MDMEYGHAVWTWSMDMEYGHGDIGSLSDEDSKVKMKVRSLTCPHS